MYLVVVLVVVVVVVVFLFMHLIFPLPPLSSLPSSFSFLFVCVFPDDDYAPVRVPKHFKEITPV